MRPLKSVVFIKRIIHKMKVPVSDKGEKKKKYPSVTVRTTKLQNTGLDYLKETTGKPKSHFVQQGITLILERNNVHQAIAARKAK